MTMTYFIFDQSDVFKVIHFMAINS